MIEKLSNLNNQVKELQVKQVDPVDPTQKIKEIVPEHQQDQSKQNSQLSKEKTEKVISSLNDFLKASSTHLKFEFHEELKKYYVAIVDDQTNEVVKEIPPKKLLDMYAAMEDYLGLLVDKKA